MAQLQQDFIDSTQKAPDFKNQQKIRYTDHSRVALRLPKFYFSKFKRIKKNKEILSILFPTIIKDITFLNIITCSERLQFNHEPFLVSFSKKLEIFGGHLLSEDDHSHWAPPYWNIMKETLSLGRTEV